MGTPSEPPINSARRPPDRSSPLSDAELVAAAERAVWSHNYQALSALPDLDPTTWAGAVQADLRCFGIDARLSWPGERQEANPRVAVLMMLKDEGDILGHNLEWLYFVGVRKYALCNNGSTDSSQTEIDDFAARHPDAEVVTIMDPLVRYVQALKTTALLRWAVTMWPDVRWMFPVDADEFLIPTKGLGVLDGLAADVSAVSIPKVIHFRHRLPVPMTANPLALMDLRSKIFLVPPKAACRAEIGLTITQGNHAIMQTDGQPVRYARGLEHGFYYREFQTRSFEHFRNKVVNGGNAIRAAQRYVGGSVGGEHWLAWVDTLESGGEPALRDVYERECVRDPAPHFIIDGFYGTRPR